MSDAAINSEAAKQVNCAKCGAPNAPDQRLCVKCGSHLYRHCRHCGRRNERNAKTCIHCGRSLQRTLGERITKALVGTPERRRLGLELLLVIAVCAILPFVLKSCVKSG